MNLLEQACHDIIMKNMNRTNEKIYLLYDTESPLAKIVSNAYISVLESMDTENIVIREFKNPPQPLYRGGMVNPDNPHLTEQNRIITSHNIDENKRVGLDHHEVYQTKLAPEHAHAPSTKDILKVTEDMPPEVEIVDPQIESIKEALITLPAGSIVILIQSTNFRLSTFRIRLELFHRGIHVVEYNHLAYIPEAQYDTFASSLIYRTPEYVRLQEVFTTLIEVNNDIMAPIPELVSGCDAGIPGTIRIQSVNNNFLTFGTVEKVRGNTGDYTGVTNKGGTYPIGEIFTEAKILDSVSGTVMIDTYPNEDFSIVVCEPFALTIERGRVLPSQDFPPGFQKLYDWVVQYESEVMVRELGFGLNPAITTQTPLRDINFHERKLGVHLSLGKKHGIYGKKLPKTDIQRFHIDVFVALEAVYIGDTRIFEDGEWCV